MSEQVDRQSEPSDATFGAPGGPPANDYGRGTAAGPDQAPIVGASPFSTSADRSPDQTAESEPHSAFSPDSEGGGEAESPRFSNAEDPDGETEDTVGTDTMRTDPEHSDTSDAFDGDGRDPQPTGSAPGVTEPPDEEPDAVGRGWAMRDGERRDVLFVLAGPLLGMGTIEHSEPPAWVDLTTVNNLDAVGDPVDGILEVEVFFNDGAPMSAGWPLDFVDSVVEALRTHISDPAPVADAPDAVPPGAAPAEAEPEPHHDPLASVPDLGSTTFFEHTPMETNDSTALVLEDVTYLGGYPGEPKKRKRCTTTFTQEGIEVDGPNGLAFRVGWDVVNSIEAQNADEARFRMNTRIHRDASAVVVQCEQAVTLILEARDCPTLPLRSAIVQLVDQLDVVVV